MYTYNVISIDSIPACEGGWNWDSQWNLGQITSDIDLSTLTVTALIRLLKQKDYLKKQARARDWIVERYGDDNLEICRRTRNAPPRPVLALVMAASVVTTVEIDGVDYSVELVELQGGDLEVYVNGVATGNLVCPWPYSYVEVEACVRQYLGIAKQGE